MRDTAQQEALTRVIEAFAKHPTSDWQIDDMARVAGYSKFHFTRFFCRHMGMPPHRWLMHYRIELAKALLERTPHDVRAITLILGYSSIGTFSSRFTSTVGCSATAYRRYRARHPYVDSFGGELRPADIPMFDDTVSVLIGKMGKPRTGP